MCVFVGLDMFYICIFIYKDRHNFYTIIKIMKLFHDYIEIARK